MQELNPHHSQYTVSKVWQTKPTFTQSTMQYCAGAGLIFTLRYKPLVETSMVPEQHETILFSQKVASNHGKRKHKHILKIQKQQVPYQSLNCRGESAWHGACLFLVIIALPGTVGEEGGWKGTLTCSNLYVLLSFNDLTQINISLNNDHTSLGCKIEAESLNGEDFLPRTISTAKYNNIKTAPQLKNPVKWSGCNSLQTWLFICAVHKQDRSRIMFQQHMHFF